MEKLKQWIQNSGKSQRTIEKDMGWKHPRLSRVCNGWEPTLKEMLAIEDLTKRKVKAQDWLDSLKQKGKTQ